MGRGDVEHVKRRVLPQPDHIEISQINLDLIAQTEMITGDALHLQWPAAGDDPALGIGQPIRRIVKQLMAPGLCLFGQTKRAVSRDINRPDRVHLKCDFHGYPLQSCSNPTWNKDAASANQKWPKAFS